MKIVLTLFAPLFVILFINPVCAQESSKSDSTLKTVLKDSIIAEFQVFVSAELLDWTPKQLHDKQTSIDNKIKLLGKHCSEKEIMELDGPVSTYMMILYSKFEFQYKEYMDGVERYTNYKKYLDSNFDFNNIDTLSLREIAQLGKSIPAKDFLPLITIGDFDSDSPSATKHELNQQNARELLTKEACDFLTELVAKYKEEGGFFDKASIRIVDALKDFKGRIYK